MHRAGVPMNNPIAYLGFPAALALMAAADITAAPDSPAALANPIAQLSAVGILGYMALNLLRAFRAERREQREADATRDKRHDEALSELADALTQLRIHCAAGHTTPGD
jgi:hypothetical protein